MSYAGTLVPFANDSEQISLVKIAANAGADVSGFETPYILWRKIVLALGGTITGNESEQTLIYKAGVLWGAEAVNPAMLPQIILNRSEIALGGDVTGRETMQRILFEIASSINSGGGGGPTIDPDLLFILSAGDDWQALGVTFARASLATYMDDAQIVRFAPHNLVANSEDLTNANWVKTDSSIAAGATAPDGTATAFSVIEAATNSWHRLDHSSGALIGGGIPNCLSIYAKAGTRPRMLIREGGAAGAQAVFVLSGAGSVESEGVGGTGTIESLGNGWYRCTLHQSYIGASIGFQFSPALSDNTYSYLGVTGAAAITVWHPQINNGPIALPYLPTGATVRLDGLRDQHYFLDAPSGTYVRTTLLEGQRTNLCLHSQEFENGTDWQVFGPAVGANASVAPDGSTTADRLVVPAAGAIRQTIPVVAGNPYTASVFVKRAPSSSATFVRITTNNTAAWSTGVSLKVLLTDEWKRVNVTFANSSAQIYFHFGALDETGSNDADCVGSVDIWGAQVEAGEFVSSYIPTVVSAVTRATDDFRPPFTEAPEELSIFARFFRTSNAQENVFTTGPSLAGSPQRLLAYMVPNAIIVQNYYDGTNINSAQSLADNVIGDSIESISRITADGSPNSEASVNRGPAAIDNGVRPTPFGAFAAPGIGLAFGGYGAFQDFIIAKGSKDLAYFRSKIDITPPELNYSLIQQANIFGDTGGGVTIDIPLPSAIGSENHILFIGCQFQTAPRSIVSISAGGTIIPITSTQGLSADGYGQACAYLIGNTPAATPLTVTFDGSCAANVAAYEIGYTGDGHPSIDFAHHIVVPAAGTTIVGPDCQMSAKRGVVFQLGAAKWSAQITGVSAPYDTHLMNPSGQAWSVALNQNSYAIPVWNQSVGSNCSFTAVGFGRNALPFVDRMYVDFSAGTDGANVTEALLRNSTKGFGGGVWIFGNGGGSGAPMKFRAGGFGLLHATPRLPDGRVYPVGHGSEFCIEYATIEQISYFVFEAMSGAGIGGGVKSPNVSCGCWIWSDVPDGDGTNVDVYAGMGGAGANFVNAKSHLNGVGQRAVSMEVGAGGGNGLGGFVRTLPSNWHFQTWLYRKVGDHEIIIYDASGTPVGSIAQFSNGVATWNNLGLGNSSNSSVPTPGFKYRFSNLILDLNGTWPLLP